MKQCPFCGCVLIGRFRYPWAKNGLRGCYVYCANCGARSGKHATIEEAEDAWNKRKDEKKHE